MMFLFRKLRFKNIETLCVNGADTISNLTGLSKEDILYLFKANKLCFQDEHGELYHPFFYDGDNKIYCLLAEIDGHAALLGDPVFWEIEEIKEMPIELP